VNTYKTKKLKFNYVFGGINYSSYKYITAKNLFKYGQTEDIKLGFLIGGGFKIINKSFGASINGFGWEGGIKYSSKKNKDYIFQDYNFDYYYLKNYSNNGVDCKIEHFHLYSNQLKLVNRISFKKIHTYKATAAYSLGEDYGLRGYKSKYLEGNKYLLINSQLEYIFKREIWKIIYPGADIFYDLGRTFQQSEQVKLSKFYHNAGLAFKLILHRSSSFDEFNFSVSFPFKREHSPYFSFQTSLDF